MLLFSFINETTKFNISNDKSIVQVFYMISHPMAREFLMPDDFPLWTCKRRLPMSLVKKKDWKCNVGHLIFSIIQLQISSRVIRTPFIIVLPRFTTNK